MLNVLFAVFAIRSRFCMYGLVLCFVFCIYIVLLHVYVCGVFDMRRSVLFRVLYICCMCGLLFMCLNIDDVFGIVVCCVWCGYVYINFCLFSVALCWFWPYLNIMFLGVDGCCFCLRICITWCVLFAVFVRIYTVYGVCCSLVVFSFVVCCFCSCICVVWCCLLFVCLYISDVFGIVICCFGFESVYMMCLCRCLLLLA